MRTIWKEELCKIASRKIIWLGIILLLLFVSFRLFAERDHYTVTIDGETFNGQRAIHKDQALTKLYAGILTEEKIQQIYKEYGFYYYDEKTESGIGNFCNKFVTEKFTNFLQTDGNDPDKIQFWNGEDRENNVGPYLEREVRFDYIHGWNDFAEMYLMTLLTVFVILILGLSPIFAEEYQLKTADILKTTRRGKQSGIWVKILAALFFAVTLTCIVSAYLWGIYLTVYGTQGLNASAILMNFTTFYGYCPDTVLGFLIFITFLGIIGAMLLTGLVSGISALCKGPFLALIISLIVFFFPAFWVKVLVWFIPGDVRKAITHFMTSMPVYLPMSTGFAFSAKHIIIHLCIALTVGIGSMIFGYHRYRNA